MVMDRTDYTYNVEIVDMNKLDDIGRIDSILKTLIRTVEGTLPGNRSFGLPAEVMDLREPGVRNDFAAALDEKMEEFLPEVLIEAIAYQQEDDRLLVQITVAPSEESEEEEE